MYAQVTGQEVLQEFLGTQEDVQLKNDDQLVQELMEYQFPAEEGEYIAMQYDRFNRVMHSPGRKNLIEGETYIQSPSYPFILKQMEDVDQVLYRISEKGIFNKYDLEKLEDKTKSVVISYFYHSDLDGISSAAIAYNALDAKIKNSEKKTVTFTSYNYKNDFISNQCAKMHLTPYAKSWKIAIILDLNLERQDFSTIVNSYDHIIWIDHHERSIYHSKTHKFPKGKMFSCLIDTRYSATYLAYLVFGNKIEEIYNKKVSFIFPSLVSIFDTKAYNRLSSKWVPILLNEGTWETYKDQFIKLRLEDKPVKLTIGVNQPIIYVRSSQDNTDVRFATSYNYGLCLNQYFLDMGCIDPWISFFSKLLFDQDCIQEMINVGKRLREIMKIKAKLTYAAETKFLATYHNLQVRGIISPTPTRFLAEKMNDTFTRMTIKYKDSEHVSVSIYTEDPYLRKITLPGIFKKYFKNCPGGGHPGAASILLNYIKLLSSFQEELHKNEDLNKIYTQIKFSSELNNTDLRNDSKLYCVFYVVATYLIYEQFTKIQELSIKESM